MSIMSLTSFKNRTLERMDFYALYVITYSSDDDQ
jgi:hypothetical protein